MTDREILDAVEELNNEVLNNCNYDGPALFVAHFDGCSAYVTFLDRTLWYEDDDERDYDEDTDSYEPLEDHLRRMASVFMAVLTKLDALLWAGVQPKEDEPRYSGYCGHDTGE